MVTKKAVDDFLKQKKWAFVGVSGNKNKFGSTAFKELKKKGIDVVAVNPNLKTWGGEPVYPSLSDIPHSVEAALIVVSPSKAMQIVQEAVELGVKHIWLQKGAESAEAIAYCQEKGVNCIHGECILMFAGPVGFPHSLHRFIWKIIGRLPQ